MLANGYYGRVMLSKHRNSGYTAITKIIDKARIEKTFAQIREPYAEIEVMKQVCRGQVHGLLNMLDYFEDSSHFYVVTKYFR